MSNGNWTFFILFSLVIGLLVGCFITEKVINWQKNKYTGGAPNKGTEDTDAEVPAGN